MTNTFRHNLENKKYIKMDWTRIIKYVIIESMKSVMYYLCNFGEIEDEIEIEMNKNIKLFSESIVEVE